MSNLKLSRALRELAEGTDSRSETARLREVFSDVEAALAAGVSRSAILKTLQDEGAFTMNMKSFESALYRIRKRHCRGHTRALDRSASIDHVDHDRGQTRGQESKTGSQSVDFRAVSAALSNESRHADFEKYDQAKTRLADRLKGKTK